MRRKRLLRQSKATLSKQEKNSESKGKIVIATVKETFMISGRILSRLY